MTRAIAWTQALRILGGVTVVALLLGAVTACGDGPRSTGGTRTSPTPAAESPRAVNEQQVGVGHSQRTVLNNLPGGHHGCAPVGDEHDVTAGGFAAGPFDSARSDYAASPAAPIGLYLVPEHAARMSGVLITGRRQGGGTLRERSANVGEAGSYRYYSLQLSIPAGGTWRIRAVSGADHGCWIVDFS